MIMETAYRITGTARETRDYLKRHGYIPPTLIDDLIFSGYVDFCGDSYRFYEIDDDGDDYGVDFEMLYARRF